MKMATVLCLLWNVQAGAIRRASNLSSFLSASSLLCDAFSDGRAGPGSVLSRMVGLRYPGAMETNIFFSPSGPPVVGILCDDTSATIGVVQLVPARLLGPARACAPDQPEIRVVGFVQNLAVSGAHRRQGQGTALMRWCEERAFSHGIRELWLAVASDDEGTRALHSSCGFAAQGEAFGNVLMRKELEAAYAPADGAAASAPPLGVSAAALGGELSVQLLYCGIASFGISALLAPFGGASLPELFTGAPGCAEPLRLVASDLALGCTVASGWLALRREAWLASPEPSAATASSSSSTGHDGGSSAGTEASLLLERTAQAQLAPAQRIVRGERRLPRVLASLGAWQLSIACAEELYYRGLFQSALGTAGGALARAVGASGPAAALAPELLALLLSSALFGLVHSAWVDEVGDAADTGQRDKAAVRATWFRETSTASLVFGALFAAAHHRLVAPIACHALVNTVPLIWLAARREEAGPVS